MENDRITFQEFLDSLNLDMAASENALKVLFSVLWPSQQPPREFTIALLSQIAEKLLKQSFLVGQKTSGLSPDQFLLSLAEQNSINAALLLLNLSIAQTILTSTQGLKNLVAFREYQNGKQNSE